MRHSSFGFEQPTRSTDWTIVKSGPSLTSVRRHLEKLGSFPAAPRR